MTQHTSVRPALALLVTALLGACVSTPTAPTAAPSPPQSEPPVQTPTIAADWRDWPVADGDWSYRASPTGTGAYYGQQGQPPLLTIRCDMATRRVSIMRPTGGDAVGPAMTVHSSFGDINWPVDTSVTGQMSATRASNDAMLDKIAFSRGRFAIDAPGAPPLAVPSWAEVGRVIEDCRG